MLILVDCSYFADQFNTELHTKFKSWLKSWSVLVAKITDKSLQIPTSPQTVGVLLQLYIIYILFLKAFTNLRYTLYLITNKLAERSFV